MKIPPSRRDDEIEEEIRAHLAMARDDRERRGQAPDDAAVDARREFGNVALVREDTRGVWTRIWIEQLIQDARYGIRQLLRNPGFTFVAVLSLALGLGTSTVIFSAVDAVVLRALPYRAPNQLVEVFQAYLPKPHMDRMPVSVPNFSDWQAGTRAFESFGALELSSFNLAGEAGPERVRAARTTANMFDVLGAGALLGRTLTPADVNAETPVAVIAYSLWQRRFGGSERVVGQALLANGQTYTIVGVMPKAFRFPIGWMVNEVEVWTPVTFSSAERGDRGNMAIDDAIARVRPGVSLARAQADIDVVASRLAGLYPQTNKDWGAYLMPLADRGVSDWRPLFAYLSLAAGLVLLIGCANVAKLLLARGLDRQRELALRTALGARRGRLIRQLLTEGVLLAGLGGGAGILIAAWGVKMLASLAPALDMQDLRFATINTRTLVFGLGLSLVTGLLFSLFPALRRSRDVQAGALERAPIGAARTVHRAQVFLAAAELTLTVPLLLCAGTLVRSFYHYTTAARGFDADHVLAMRVALPQQKYPQDAQLSNFFGSLVSALATAPGVASVAAGSSAPLEDAGDVMKYGVIGQPARTAADAPLAELVSVSRDYFRTIGIPIRRGRALTSSDRAGAPPVALVSEMLARRAFPGRDPIGQQIQLLGDINASTGSHASGPPLEVVGVVGDTGSYYVYDSPTPHIYVPLDQSPRRANSLLVKTSGDPTSVVQEIRRVMQTLDPDQPVYNIQPLDKLVTDHHGVLRLNTALLATFGGIGLMLTLIGVYGVMAYVVGQRVREFAVRMALGATRRQILGLVMASGVWLSASGLCAGLLMTWPVMTVFARIVKTAENLDLVFTGPWFVIGVCGAISAVALFACLLPARRATTVPPMEVLRLE